ncbi:MAG TPA: hypothetical protein VFP60_17330 [Pseudolabrys sp.]|nr:hypothetical protein [Pseudolabrys sp.]
MMRTAMRYGLSVAALAAFAGAANAAPREIFGYAGELGEWELLATVEDQSRGRAGEYSGPLTMTHVGICTQDGPEKRTGEIRFQLAESSTRLNAVMFLAGVECTFSGRRTDFYSGLMTCADQRVLPLKLWVK